MIQIGCCGWQIARARYVAQFPVVELQDPFYQMPAPSLAAKWKNSVPSEFTFCLKAWQLITHTPASPTYRRLKHRVGASEQELYGSFRPTEQVRLAWERTAEIARELHAAVVVFQCPASFDASPKHLRNFRRFFEDLDREGRLLAWEPRGPWRPDVVKGLCAEFDLLHAVDPFTTESVHGETLYWRTHGGAGYRHIYTEEELAWLAGQARKAAADGRDVFALFNNMAMVKDACRFQDRLARQV